MTLRKKTLLTFGIMCAALVVVLYGVSRTILLRSFAELEEQSFNRSVHRTINIFNEHVAQLDRLRLIGRHGMTPAGLWKTETRAT